MVAFQAPPFSPGKIPEKGWTASFAESRKTYQKYVWEKTKSGLTDVRPACSAKPSNLALPSASTSPVRKRFGALGGTGPSGECDEVEVLIVRSLLVSAAVALAYL